VETWTGEYRRLADGGIHPDCSFTPDGQALLLARRSDGDTFCYELWDIRQNRRRVRIDGEPGSAARFSRDCSLLLQETEKDMPEVFAWDVSDGHVILRPEEGGRCHWFNVTPDETRGLLYRDDDSMLIVDLRTGTPLFEFPDKGTHSACISPTGGLIAEASAGGMTRLWQRRRSEYWWARALIPELWLMLFFTVAMMWSVRHDRRRFG